jgi:hypothetical protein
MIQFGRFLFYLLAFIRAKFNELTTVKLMEDLQGDMSAKLQKCRLLEGEWSHWDDLF